MTAHEDLYRPLDEPDDHADSLLEPSWRGVLPPETLAIYEAAGYGSEQEPGAHPALLVIDMTYSFVGWRPLPIMESIAELRSSSGIAAWRAVRNTETLLGEFRARGLPVLYTRRFSIGTAPSDGLWATKNKRRAEDLAVGDAGNEIAAPIAPNDDEVVIEKGKPSGFFGTRLDEELKARGVDTVVIVGGVTSGCIRATAIDAFSLDYRVMVVDDAVFDRSPLSHKINLYDLNQKYSNVVGTEDACKYLASLDDTA